MSAFASCVNRSEPCAPQSSREWIRVRGKAVTRPFYTRPALADDPNDERSGW